MRREPPAFFLVTTRCYNHNSGLSPACRRRIRQRTIRSLSRSVPADMRKTTTNGTAMTTGHHSGSSTSHHDQPMTPVSFSTSSTTSTEKGPGGASRHARFR